MVLTPNNKNNDQYKAVVLNQNDMRNQPILYTKQELELLRRELDQPSLIGRTIANNIRHVDAFMDLPLEVPGHGEAGGYEHNRHKQNYRHMHLAGSLFVITQEKKYASFVIELLSLYADKYLTFDFHVQKNTNPTGRLFHQILNEHCWLFFSSLAYSCVVSEMTNGQRDRIIEKLFTPMLHMFTDKYAHDFDRIHNHGIWAVAAVGICGLAIGQRDYLTKSVYGLRNDASGGFLAQISQLFSPDGYYMEGPYYHRYAIHPTCIFSEVLHRHMPELDIYAYKSGVIGRTVKALLASAYPNGKFPAFNDASKTMGVTDAGVQVAVSILAEHYGCDDNIVGMAELQGGVWLHACGLTLSNEHSLAKQQNKIVTPYWPSIELNEGEHGDHGAQGFLRLKGADNDIAQLNMNYGQHGMGHGHFDTLGITFFNRGQEVLNEYGFARWVNVEPKFGGRYLPENVSYARQTVAHNIVTVDQQSQNDFKVEKADGVHGTPHFFCADHPTCIGMSAFANEHYQNIGMQRSAFLLKDDRFDAPLLIDLFRLEANEQHSYDYAQQYTGQLINTNFDYHTYEELEPLGTDNGYQHLWKHATGQVGNSALVSWLQGHTYYSWLGISSNEGDEVIFTSVGAADANFNLRNDTGFMLRSQGATTLFASVLETHGYFNEEFEQSTQARGQLQEIQVIGHNSIGSVITFSTANTRFLLMVSNDQDCQKETNHHVEFNGVAYHWSGFYSLEICPVVGE